MDSQRFYLCYIKAEIPHQENNRFPFISLISITLLSFAVHCSERNFLLLQQIYTRFCFVLTISHYLTLSQHN